MPEPYGVDPDPIIPNLPGEPVVRESEDQILDTLAADIFVHALACVRTFGDFHLAISAGGFQERLCRRLMIDPTVRALPWNRTHVWAISDRPDPSGRSRFMDIVELLEGHAGIPQGHLHEPDHAHDSAADDYESRLQQVLAWREKGQDRLDLAVLVVEPDGRMGGIDPRQDSASDEPRLVIPADGPAGGRAAGPASGVAMTARLINATRLITVVATGATAGSRIREIDPRRGMAFPSPIGGSLRWYLDREACPA